MRQLIDLIKQWSFGMKQASFHLAVNVAGKQQKRLQKSGRQWGVVRAPGTKVL